MNTTEDIQIGDTVLVTSGEWLDGLGGIPMRVLEISRSILGTILRCATVESIEAPKSLVPYRYNLRPENVEAVR